MQPDDHNVITHEGADTNPVLRLLSESKRAKRSLGEALGERDKNAGFDRCMVGGESCGESAIRAHCIPETVLELIMNGSREVVAAHSQPPKTAVQWLHEYPLKTMSISRFNAARWACRPHDDTFRSLDTKRLEALTDSNLFLMVYKITVYLTHRLLHTGERLATPILDPDTATPERLSQRSEEYLKEIVRIMTFSAVRVCWTKWAMDKFLRNEEYDKLEYRASYWKTTPTMAAVGMKLVEGPGTIGTWYGQNSLNPVWMALLPQEYGQLMITASPRGAGPYARNIHEGVSKNREEYVGGDDAWTRLMCHKVLTSATDVAISEERIQQLNGHGRDRLREFLLLRNVADARQLEYPNVLNTR